MILNKNFQCFQSFLDGERVTKYLTNDARNNLLLGAATDITCRYYDLAADLVSVVSITNNVFSCFPST